jgi:hypothetical protein
VVGGAGRGERKVWRPRREKEEERRREEGEKTAAALEGAGGEGREAGG